MSTSISQITLIFNINSVIHCLAIVKNSILQSSPPAPEASETGIAVIPALWAWDRRHQDDQLLDYPTAAVAGHETIDGRQYSTA